MSIKANSKRVSVTLDANLLKGVDTLKRKVYYDAPYSELMRDLVAIGVEQMLKKPEKKGD